MLNFLNNNGKKKNGLTSESSSNNDEGDEYHRLPILIIPGFMSSGLKIQTSEVHPKWQGKRLWLNLGSLGLEKLAKVARKPWDKKKNKNQTLRKQQQPEPSDPATPRKDSQASDESEGGANDKNDNNNANAAGETSVANNGAGNNHENNNIIENETKVEESSPSQQSKRSLWLQHMMLQSDLKSEQDGIRVHAIPGLAGVNYMYPSFLTNMITYVFGPLIVFLAKEGGYTPEVDLQAAPWDWRIPPCQLEERDQYFSKTLDQIQTMYEQCHQKPIVLLGHSQGSQVAHYLLNFALETKGQEWIDQHIYSYMPVSGTNAGVPKAIKQVVLVDHSCLDPFLTFEEEVLFSRSLGSTPWMFPTQLAPQTPAIAWVRPQGMLEIQVVEALEVLEFIRGRRVHERPKKYQLQAALGKIGVKSSVRLVSSHFIEGNGNVDFTTETFSFTTPPNSFPDKGDLTLQLYLREPDWTNSAKAQWHRHFHNPPAAQHSSWLWGWICWIFRMIIRLICCVFDIAVFPLTLLNQLTVEASAVLAVSESISLEELEFDQPSNETVTLTHIDDSRGTWLFSRQTFRQVHVKVQVVWKPFDTSAQPVQQLCDPIATLNQPMPLEIVNKVTGETYHSMSGHDLIHREGEEMKSYLKALYKLYDTDPLGPRKSAMDAPPVKRTHAIHGKNIPTEVGAFYHRTDACVSKRELGVPLYQLDNTGATLVTHTDQYAVDGYLLKEIPSPDKPSGDGTVPYRSLAAMQNWKESMESLTVVELQEAEHRNILRNKEFQTEVLKYCRRKREEF